jgi:ATP-dependent Clp protease ATP-binding subunit ClpA
VNLAENSKLLGLEAHLNAHIRGQNYVMPRIVSLLRRGQLGLTKSNRPRGSFLFLGPTGVGVKCRSAVIKSAVFWPNWGHKFG